MAGSIVSSGSMADTIAAAAVLERNARRGGGGYGGRNNFSNKQAKSALEIEKLRGATEIEKQRMVTEGGKYKVDAMEAGATERTGIQTSATTLDARERTKAEMKDRGEHRKAMADLNKFIVNEKMKSIREANALQERSFKANLAESSSQYKRGMDFVEDQSEKRDKIAWAKLATISETIKHNQNRSDQIFKLQTEMRKKAEENKKYRAFAKAQEKQVLANFDQSAASFASGNSTAEDVVNSANNALNRRARAFFDDPSGKTLAGNGTAMAAAAMIYAGTQLADKFTTMPTREDAASGPNLAASLVKLLTQKNSNFIRNHMSDQGVTVENGRLLIRGVPSDNISYADLQKFMAELDKTIPDEGREFKFPHNIGDATDDPFINTYGGKNSGFVNNWLLGNMWHVAIKPKFYTNIAARLRSEVRLAGGGARNPESDKFNTAAQKYYRGQRWLSNQVAQYNVARQKNPKLAVSIEEQHERATWDIYVTMVTGTSVEEKVTGFGPEIEDIQKGIKDQVDILKAQGDAPVIPPVKVTPPAMPEPIALDHALSE